MSRYHSRAGHSGAKERQRGEGANFGCVVHGVKITIFSARLFHTVCSVTIYCRDGEKAGEGEGMGEENSGGR